MGSLKLSAALAAALLLGQSSAALDPIIMKGSKFFFKNGTQFFMKGIAYQQDIGAAGTGSSTGSVTYTDPLADSVACQRDVPLLAALKTNTIRTYAIDPKKDHSACMSLLDKAGIYVIADLSEPATSINRDAPQWNTDLFDRYKGVVDALAPYSNVIGFFAGNEVTNQRNNTPASAYVKAAVRDTKKYIADKQSAGGRWMGVGYAANDDAEIRIAMAHYFNCGEQKEAIDYWGYNIYSWCGESSMEKSGYTKQVDFFRNYSVPVFFAEYGCQNPGGADARIWQETTALYSNEMTDVISGGIVYMYHEETNDFGLVKVANGQASTMKNYNALKTVIASVAPSSTAMSNYNPTNSPQPCPPVSDAWNVGVGLPPTPNRQTCECMFAGITCAPAKNLAQKDYGALFGNICGQKGNPCAGINGNTATGIYGAYSMCNDQQKLGYVLDTYYKMNGNKASDCAWNGAATLVTPAQVASSCRPLLDQASATNSVAQTAPAAGTGTGAPGKPNAAAGSPLEGAFSLGGLVATFYAMAAMVAGAGLILL